MRFKSDRQRKAVMCKYYKITSPKVIAGHIVKTKSEGRKLLEAAVGLDSRFKVTSKAIKYTPYMQEDFRKNPHVDFCDKFVRVSPHPLPDRPEYGDYFRYARGQGASIKDSADYAFNQIKRRKRR